MMAAFDVSACSGLFMGCRGQCHDSERAGENLPGVAAVSQDYWIRPMRQPVLLVIVPGPSWCGVS